MATNKNDINLDVVTQVIDDYELTYFDFQTISKYVGSKVAHLENIIENLVKKEFLYRLEKGKYCRRNFRNEHVIGTFLAHNGVIAYWTALNLHGLTEQFSNTIFVQTDRQKISKKVFGVNYKFIAVKKSKIGSIGTSGYGNYAYKMTNVEKTILDCLDLPEYSGGTNELYAAINNAKLNSAKLIEAAESIDNIAVVKRLGYLLELYKVERVKKFIEYALTKVNKKYNLLDPQGESVGDFNNRWRLRLNIDESTLLNIANKLY